MTTVITVTIIVILITAAVIFNNIKERKSKANQQFEDKMKGIYNKELNEYFQKMNIERTIQGYDEALNERLNNKK